MHRFARSYHNKVERKWIAMPSKSQNQHVKSTPHQDGKQEGLYNDPTGTSNSTIGVRLSHREEFGLEDNPFPFKPKEDPMMSRFEKLMRGVKKSD